MKIRFFFIIVITSIVSCSTDDKPEFRQFSNEDYDFISTVYKDMSQITTLRDQQNNEVRVH